MGEKTYKLKKSTPTKEYEEILNHSQVCEMLLSAGFMMMLNRMQIGEKLYYNEIQVEFERIS